MQLPKGLFFDPKRNRYRVRLYRGSEVVLLRYYRTYEEASDAYYAALNDRPEIISGPGSLDPNALFNYLTA